jgi:peptidoglycan hydrolase-like protein with peptidoglycan-binding domain
MQQHTTGSPRLFKRGVRGPAVREMQEKLARLGLNVEADGIFGENTERAVIQLQTMFGYDVDGIVGPGTTFLIDQQLGLGWNAQAPDAYERAMRAQGKGPAQTKQSAESAPAPVGKAAQVGKPAPVGKDTPSKATSPQPPMKKPRPDKH